MGKGRGPQGSGWRPKQAAAVGGALGQSLEGLGSLIPSRPFPRPTFPGGLCPLQTFCPLERFQKLPCASGDGCGRASGQERAQRVTVIPTLRSHLKSFAMCMDYFKERKNVQIHTPHHPAPTLLSNPFLSRL